MDINVLEFKESNNYLIKSGELNYSTQYTLNGKKIEKVVRNGDLVITDKDVLEYIPQERTITHYKKGDVKMSIKEYEAIPKYFDEYNTDSEIVEIIKEKKKAEGFIAVYQKVEPCPINIVVVGLIEDVGSKFISFVIHGNSFHTVSNLYSISGRTVSMDEYKKMSRELAEHATFGTDNRTYLRFMKINGNYAFNDGNPFGDYSYIESFTDLKKAKEAEETVRQSVRDAVNSEVFKKEFTSQKNIKILSKLRTIKKLKTAKAKNELIDILIDDISDYVSRTN